MSIQEVEGPFGVPVPKSQEAATLKAEELSLFDSTAVAVSSVAPAYSLSTTMVLLWGIAGVAYVGPAVIWVCFIPVLFIAFSYFHLNRKDPDCGASYSWLSKLISPYFGWFNGWVQIATSVIFCVIAPITAAQNTLQFLNEENWISQATLNSLWIQAIVAALWLALVTFICVWGIRYTTNFQWVMVIIEYLAVLGFSIWGIIRVAATHPAHTINFQWAWMNPLHIGSFAALASGAALAVFFFWGWDTSVNLNEESKNASHTPGRAAIISMFLLLIIFIINIIAIQMWVPRAELSSLYNSNNPTTVMLYFAQHAVGHWALFVMLIAVLSSTVGTTQTTLLPSARVTLSMARDKVFPKVFATIEPSRQTPAVGTLVIAFICLIGIMLYAASSSVNNLFNHLIGDIGVLIAFYYGVTGITCAWAYRRVAFKSAVFFFTGILLPFLAGIVLLLVGVEVVHSSGVRYSLPILITFGLGIPLVVVAKLVTSGNFFKVKTIAYDSID